MHETCIAHAVASQVRSDPPDATETTSEIQTTINGATTDTTTAEPTTQDTTGAPVS